MVGIPGLTLRNDFLFSVWQILAVSVADFVAENKKPPENQEVLSLNL